MTILDAAGVISLLANQPAANQVADLLGSGDTAITAVNLAEVVDKFERIRGYPRQHVLDAIQQLADAGLTILPVEDQDGRRAGALRAEHYHHRRQAVSLADCVALAMAINRDARLATSDHVLADLARQLDIELVPLPNSAGQLP